MKNRFNFGLFLIFLIFINFKVILVNEETLILICFTAFTFLVVSRLSDSISEFFHSQVTQIKSSFLTSSFQFIKKTESHQVKTLTSLPWPKVFRDLKLEFYQFNVFLLSNFEISYRLTLRNHLNKKLEFSKRFESQISKLIVTVILEKLQKICKLHTFCSDVLTLPAVLTMNKVYFREHLKKIIF